MNLYKQIIEQYEALTNTCLEYLKCKGIDTSYKYITDIEYHECEGHINATIYKPRLKIFLGRNDYEYNDEFNIYCNELNNFVENYK